MKIPEELKVFLSLEGAEERLGVVQTLVTAEKVEALRLVLPKLDPNAANYEHHLTFLDTLRRLRNKGSHESGISPEDATKLSQEPEVLAIIKDFPDALWAKVKELLQYLKSLPL